MPTIHRLPPQLAERIAAGEVVERPASIVKELCENSIDAKATQIEVRVDRGGIEKIDVRDNGHGIARDQLVRALENHATSKITKAEDLDAIHSLGFRGEALASIAAVSHLSLTSHAADGEQAWQVIAQQGTRQEPKSAALNPGCWIEITKLFHNVPARRKFLRTPATEFAQIDKVFIRIALSHPHIAFSLKHNNKFVHKLPAVEKHEERVKALLKEDFYQKSIFIDSGTSAYHVKGWIIKPAHAGQHTNNQYIYINGRFVRDKIISHACKQGYGDLLYSRLVPSYVLFVKVPADEVDVNVHPAKHEVRFRQGQLVHSLISGCIKKHLTKLDDAPLAMPSVQSQSRDKPKHGYDRSTNQPGWQMQDTVGDSYPTHSPPNQSQGAGATQAFPQPNYTSRAATYHPDTYPLNKPSSGKHSHHRSHIKPTSNAENGYSDQHSNQLSFPLGVAIGLLHNVYIIAMNEKGLVVVDAHAAHERILFEDLKNEYRAGKWGQQTLLFPISIELTAGETAFISEHTDLFADWGFELRVVGTTSIAIRAMPSLLAQDHLAELLKSLTHLLQEYQADGKEVTAMAADKILSTMACHGAVRSNRKMTTAEMNALLRLLEKTPRNYACNHGRPTWIEIDRGDFDRQLLHGK